MLFVQLLENLPNPFDLLLCGLATWRISNIIIHERIARPVRRIIGISDTEPYVETLLTELFECVWCLSVWVSLVLISLLLLVPSIGIVIVYIFSLSTIAVLLDKIIGG